MTAPPRYPAVSVKLSDGNAANIDGNAFSIIGSVRRELRREVGPAAAREWTAAAFGVHSYDELLRLAIRTVEIE